MRPKPPTTTTKHPHLSVVQLFKEPLRCSEKEILTNFAAAVNPLRSLSCQPGRLPLPPPRTAPHCQNPRCREEGRIIDGRMAMSMTRPTFFGDKGLLDHGKAPINSAQQIQTSVFRPAGQPFDRAEAQDPCPRLALHSVEPRPAQSYAALPMCFRSVLPV